jgi:hypothetical protein
MDEAHRAAGFAEPLRPVQPTRAELRASAMRRALPLLIVLAIQALLFFHDLDLLDAWGDELFTLQVVTRPIREIAPLLRQDIHPPLYFYLLHGWVMLPLPWAGMAALRAFSVLATLLATALFDALWLRGWKPARRVFALVFFAFSPCLLLYGRMARSYALQTALAMVAVFLLWRWMRQPRAVLSCALPAVATAVALLYTHYLPALAILAGFAVGAWRSVGPARIALFGAAAAALYAPWLVTLAGALRGWGRAAAFQSSYALTRSVVLEHGLKAGFGLVSLTVGESFFFPALLLVPALSWTAWSGCRLRAFGPSLRPLLLIAAVAGYAGASRWVAWPFPPARLLWLLPFLTLAVAMGMGRYRPRMRQALAAAILVSIASSWVLYFERRNFVNLGYSAPLREIASRIRASASAEDLVVVDAYNADAAAIRYYLGDGVRLIGLRDKTAAATLAVAPAAPAIWVVRNTHDVSPDKLAGKVEADLCAGRRREVAGYRPYAQWQRAALHLATGEDAPEYYYQVAVCRSSSR